MVWRGVVCASGMPGAPTGQSCAINQAGMCWGGQAELVIKVHRVRAWPSSAFPRAAHVPARPWHTSSCQAT